MRCECGNSRGLHDAAELGLALGTCRGARPWLGAHAQEPCGLPSRLLIRTASNAYFPQVLSALSLPEHGSGAPKKAVEAQWASSRSSTTASPRVHQAACRRSRRRSRAHDDEDVLDAIANFKRRRSADERPVKLVELDALLAVPEGYGDDVPIDPDFHARRLPDRCWRAPPLSDPIAAVIQLHRLREVLALIGFTRFEAVVPDIDGEYDTDVERARARARAAVVPRRREPRRRALRRSSTARQSTIGLAARALPDSPRRARRRPWRGGRSSARSSARSRAVRTCCCTRSRTSLQSLSRCAAATRRARIRERIYADYEAEPLRPCSSTQRAPMPRARSAGSCNRRATSPTTLQLALQRRRAVLERPGLRPARPW